MRAPISHPMWRGNQTMMLSGYREAVPYILLLNWLPQLDIVGLLQGY
jgi:hypothetical protein